MSGGAGVVGRLAGVRSPISGGGGRGGGWLCVGMGGLWLSLASFSVCTHLRNSPLVSPQPNSSFFITHASQETTRAAAPPGSTEGNAPTPPSLDTSTSGTSSSASPPPGPIDNWPLLLSSSSSAVRGGGVSRELRPGLVYGDDYQVRKACACIYMCVSQG